jgi:hypothetical protein
MFRLENAHKLATKEDPWHLHKILGTVCLVHFTYRLARLFATGSMHFHTPQDMYMIHLHGVLSASSLIFPLPSVRNAAKPMIYPEFRAHSILFACRSVAACCMHYSGYHYTWIMLLCIQTMGVADLITRHYRSQRATSTTTTTTTMRNMPFDPAITTKEQQSIIQMQSRLQLGATWFMLVNVDTAFLPLLAIQLAAFLMTLVRKSIIGTQTWHLLYSVALWLNYEVLAQFTPGQLVMITILYNLHHRVCFPARINKYLVWGLHFMVYTMWMESGSAAYVSEWIHGVVGGQWRWSVLVRVAVVGHYAGNVYTYRALFIQPLSVQDKN